MARFGEVFRELLENSNYTADSLADEMNISRPYVYTIKKKNSIDMEMLEKVCRTLKVNPLIFFDSDVARMEVPSKYVYNNTAILGMATMTIGATEEINNLKKLIEEKERFIQYLLKQLEKEDKKL